MKNSILKLIAVSVILILFFACSDNNALENLETKLKELGVTRGNYIRLEPDPEAGAGTIERVQRKIRVYQSSE